MSYQKANTILPSELIELIQTYIDGDYIYIQRKEEKRIRSLGVPVLQHERNWILEILIFIKIFYPE